MIVADTDDNADESHVMRALGAAAAVYLETTLMGGERIGVSSWSSTILATVEAMHPGPPRSPTRWCRCSAGSAT
ncbi:hypothetical protein [Paractinoplanes durhamensis]|uniref:hypothetical protein n=1 Tax=Paractinoplanes durhamensis TaxID=113563 RepID=UPI00362E7F18